MKKKGISIIKKGIKQSLDLIPGIRKCPEGIPTSGTQSGMIIHNSEEELALQRQIVFKYDIKISILVPLYNTRIPFLCEMIDSVLAQSYGNWQLCLADGSDEDHDAVGRFCRDYAKKDSRICYRKLKGNLGISANTNACVKMAEGEYIALLDHDDVLHPAALFMVMKEICDKDADLIYTDELMFKSPHKEHVIMAYHKPDYAPDNLRSCNYITHFTVFRRSLLEKTGLFRSRYDGSQDYDMILRLTAVAKIIIHIPEVLYYWRAHHDSVAGDPDAKDYAYVAGRRAIAASLRRERLSGHVKRNPDYPGYYRVYYDIKDHPLISIIITDCDHIKTLHGCLRSIEEESDYRHFEIILVEHRNSSQGLRSYHKKISNRWTNIRIISLKHDVNYSAMTNYAVEQASGEYILLLSSYVKIISPGWMTEMLMYAQRKDVGAVGAKLYYPDDTIRHAGVILGMNGTAGYPFQGASRTYAGYMGRLIFAQDMSAVSGDCMLLCRDIWEEAGGMNEYFDNYFKDLDLCMRIRKAGYLIVWTPYAELYHRKYRSLMDYSCDAMDDGKLDKAVRRFKWYWGKEISRGDPYYNPVLSLVESNAFDESEPQFDSILDQRRFIEKKAIDQLLLTNTYRPMKLAHFLRRMVKQGLNNDEYERRAFRRWFISCITGNEDPTRSDHRFNPLFDVIKTLEQPDSSYTDVIDPMTEEVEVELFFKNELCSRNYQFISNQFSRADLDRQKETQFDKSIVFSIIVPLYNTPSDFLREMIRSVQNQTYTSWELCLADGSEEGHDYVGEICRTFAEKDHRIKYRKLARNFGISGNSNACLSMAKGEYIALLDHDDLLHPAALYEIMTAVCEKDADFIYTDEATFESPDLHNIIRIHFKPDYAPDNLKSNNYICHFTVFSRSLLDQTPWFRSEYDGSQDHDLILRLTGLANEIVHIPKVLYFWRAHPESTAMSHGFKEYAGAAGSRAVQDYIESEGLSAKVEAMRDLPGFYRIHYDILGNPKISIIIPSSDHMDDLCNCLESIEEKSTYRNYEIIVVDNNSEHTMTFAMYDLIQKRWPDVKVFSYPGSFNYSAINNYAVRELVTGDYILLLNNDTEVIAPSWMEEMLMYAQRQDVGAVGAKLWYPDDTIQHAGVVLGMLNLAGHIFRSFPDDNPGYMGRLRYTQNYSVVTAACMMMRKEVWEQAGGMDEDLKVAFNDVDLCMRIRKNGYLIVWTPFAELYHHESRSRGDDDVPEKRDRFISEVFYFRKKWYKELAAGDPYYNPNMTLLKTDCSLKEAEEESHRPVFQRMRVMLIAEQCALQEKENEIGLTSRTEEILTLYCPCVSRIAVACMSDQEGKDYKITRNRTDYYLLNVNMKYDASSKDQAVFKEKIKKVIDDFHPDIIQCFGAEWPYCLIAEYSPVPVVVHMMGFLNIYHPMIEAVCWWDEESSTSYKNTVSEAGKKLFNRANAAESRVMKANSYYMGRTDWDKNIVKYYSNGARYYHIPEPQKPLVYKAAGTWRYKHKGKLRLFTLSSADYRKGNEIILKTALLLRDLLGLDFEWRVAGSKEYFPFFENRTGIDHATVYINLLGRIETEQIIEEMKNADFFIHPSIIDNSSNAICEAQLIGCPVLASDVGGNAQIIEDKVTGFLYPYNEPHALAFLIGNLRYEEDYLTQISANEVNTAHHRHNPERIACKLEKAYLDIIEDFRTKHLNHL